jgi:mono/diheme cytochrome c family protein
MKTHKNKNNILYCLLALAALLVLAIGLAWPRAEMIPSSSPASWAATPENIRRGAYLARVGDCMACHSARGGAPYAGGRALDTPFGRIHAPNITSSREHGIGAWTADQFWDALHNGVGRDGRLLYPAFPYPNYTRITRDDADALFAFMRTIPAADTARRAHALRFPYNLQASLAAWRLAYFKPGVYKGGKDGGNSAEWNRGAYLVEGLGHCAACHSSRNALGASRPGLSGGLIPMQGWYAPSLTSDTEAGVGRWQVGDIAQLLRSGVSPHGAVTGPMAEVVGRSLQYLSENDARAMAVYLKSLPASPGEKLPGASGAQFEQVLAQGARLYEANCMECHGRDGRGLPPHYPPLAGNRSLTTVSPVNPIRLVINGGFPPATGGNPRPYGMPPFGHLLDDGEVAALVTYLRNSWGNQAPPVTAVEVNRYRSVPLE